MNLDRRSAGSRQSISHGYAVMRERPGIDDDAHRTWSERLNCVDEMSLVVGLDVLDPQRWIRAQRDCCQVSHDFGQGRLPVYTGLTSAKQVEVWSIQDQDIVPLDLPHCWFTRHEWATLAAQLRTGSTMVMRRSSII